MATEVFSTRLLRDGDNEYRVRINGEYIAGRVRWSTDAWTAAVATNDGYDPLPGNYRFRSTAVDDVVAAWMADNSDVPLLPELTKPQHEAIERARQHPEKILHADPRVARALLAKGYVRVYQTGFGTDNQVYELTLRECVQ